MGTQSPESDRFIKIMYPFHVLIVQRREVHIYKDEEDETIMENVDDEIFSSEDVILWLMFKITGSYYMHSIEKYISSSSNGQLALGSEVPSLWLGAGTHVLQLWLQQKEALPHPHPGLVSTCFCITVYIYIIIKLKNIFNL